MARRPETSSLIAVHGRTYWDAEVEVDLASLAAGKGKIDARVEVVAGGFAMNAARALGPILPEGGLRVVTLTTWADWHRLAAALPEGAILDAIVSRELTPPPVSVIINPARECRILRDKHEHDGDAWRVDRVAEGALAARLQILGRLPHRYAAAVMARARREEARFAWVGGSALGDDLMRDCDILCVNAVEAARMLGEEGTPKQLAESLLGRARTADAIRLVTGAGRASTAAAFREGKRPKVLESTPAAVDPERINMLKGVGDAFAAHFLAAACFDDERAPRKRLDPAAGLAAGQRAAARFLTGRRA